jgi:hypothetical protein
MSVLAICLKEAPWRALEEARGFVGQFAPLVALLSIRTDHISSRFATGDCNKTVIAPLYLSRLTECPAGAGADSEAMMADRQTELRDE